MRSEIKARTQKFVAVSREGNSGAGMEEGAPKGPKGSRRQHNATVKAIRLFSASVK
jgi:hypothetical protein